MGTTISYFLNLQIQRNFLAFKNIHGKKSKKYVTFYRLVHSGANNLPSRIHFSLSLRSYLYSCYWRISTPSPSSCWNAYVEPVHAVVSSVQCVRTCVRAYAHTIVPFYQSLKTSFRRCRRKYDTYNNDINNGKKNLGVRRYRSCMPTRYSGSYPVGCNSMKEKFTKKTFKCSLDKCTW